VAIAHLSAVDDGPPLWQIDLLAALRESGHT